MILCLPHRSVVLAGVNTHVCKRALKPTRCYPYRNNPGNSSLWGCCDLGSVAITRDGAPITSGLSQCNISCLPASDLNPPVHSQQSGHQVRCMALLRILKCLHGCYGLNCISPKFYVEALTPNVTTFRDRAFRR